MCTEEPVVRPADDTVTRVLGAVVRGEPRAADQLLPLVYDELRRQAAAQLACEAPGQTLNATALVHEAYLRLVGGDRDKDWDGRRHFFAAAAEAMRRILIEAARRKRAVRHGGGLHRRPLEEGAAGLATPEPDDRLIALDEALIRSPPRIRPRPSWSGCGCMPASLSKRRPPRCGSPGPPPPGTGPMPVPGSTTRSRATVRTTEAIRKIIQKDVRRAGVFSRMRSGGDEIVIRLDHSHEPTKCRCRVDLPRRPGAA